MLLKQRTDNFPGKTGYKYLSTTIEYATGVGADWVSLYGQKFAFHLHMSDSFRLLRNNKETGPFSLEELLQHSLKAYDLVWVEGKCAGWRYPTELEILKPYLEEENLQTEHTHPVQKHIATIKENMNKVPEPPIVETETIIEEQEITAEALEKKATEIYLRVQAYTNQKEKQGNLPETKHSRSLDDLKQEYADWLHKKNHKSLHNNKLKYLVPAILILLVGFASFFFINKNNGSDQIPVKQNYYLSHAAEKPGDYTKQKNNKSTISSTSQSFAKAPEKKQSTVDEFLDSVNRELAKQDARLKSAPSISKYKKPALKLTSNTTKEETQVKSSNKIDLSAFIKLDGKYNHDRFKNISSLEITINNYSSEVLNKLAVDIFYYKQNNKLFDKETVYFSNIQPGGSFTLTTPGNSKARTAKFELGRIN